MRSCKLPGLAIVLVLSVAPSSLAQTLYGSLVGNVRDASDAAVAEAKVTIVHKQTNQVRETLTNQLGVFNFPTIPSGFYEVRVTKEGFQTFVKTGVEVTINSVVRVDATLQVGSVTEAVSVTASAAALQADRSEIRAEVTSTTLVNIPVPPGRNYQQLFRMLPGFTPPDNAHSIPTNPTRALVFNVNGSSNSTNNVRIDGASSTNIWLPHITAYVPALESIETVNVVSNSFDAEQGLAGGAAINVQIKSGTNEVHGSGFWYNHNNGTKARPFFFPANERNPKMIFNQFGGTVGGPIRRDKLFYFVSYEGTYNREFAAALYTVPTALTRQGIMTESNNPVYDPLTGNFNGQGRTPFPGQIVPASRFDPIAVKIRDLTPMPTFADRLTQNYFGIGNFLFDRDTVDSKVNWNASDKFTMYGRFSLLDYRFFGPPAFGDFGGPPIKGGNEGNGSGNTYSVTLAGTYVLSPTFIVDANFGYTRMDTGVEQPGLGRNLGLEVLGIPGTNGTRRFESGWPRFVISNYTTVGTANNTFMPYFRRDPQYQYVANANWTRGSHNVRFGFDFYNQHMNHAQAEFPGAFHGASGGFEFAGGITGLNGGPAPNQWNSYAAFLLGMASNAGRILQVPDEYSTRVWLNSLYVRDQWQVNRKLTLNFGTRWEYFPMPTRADRGMERYDFRTGQMLVCGHGVVPRDCGVWNSKRLFAPRVGLAYRATDTFVIRAGYGITNDPFSVARPHRTNHPVLIAHNIAAPNTWQPATTLQQGIAPVSAPNLGNGIIDVPVTAAVNSVDERFRRGYVQSWNFSLQKELGAGFIGQAAYVATRQTRQLGYFDRNAGQIPGAGRDGQPYFHTHNRLVRTAVFGPVATSKYDSLQLTVERRFHAGYQIQAAYTWSKALGICGINNSDNDPCIQALGFQNLARARQSIDRPHNLQVSGIVELPFGRGKRWANAGGFAGNVFGGWQLNALFSSFTGTPFTVTSSGASLNMPGNTQRADLVGPVRKLGGTGPGQAFYDWTSFAPVIEPRFGTLGYNTVRGPGVINLDLGLFRRFQIREGLRLEFRAEAFNATNTPHFANPSTNISNLRLRPDGTFQSGVFEITGVNALGREGIDERVFRLGLRFQF
jgi:hypothetical protein